MFPTTQNLSMMSRIQKIQSETGSKILYTQKIVADVYKSIGPDGLIDAVTASQLLLMYAEDMVAVSKYIAALEQEVDSLNIQLNGTLIYETEPNKV